MTATIKQIKEELRKESSRSAWGRGVIAYAEELIDGLYWMDDSEELNENTLEKTLLNGASDWSAYSWGGCSLIYNGDVCERLATPSEQKRTDGGRLNPNSQEQWLDTQARALYQASNLIARIVKRGGAR